MWRCNLLLSWILLLTTVVVQVCNCQTIYPPYPTTTESTLMENGVTVVVKDCYVLPDFAGIPLTNPFYLFSNALMTVAIALVLALLVV